MDLLEADGIRVSFNNRMILSNIYFSCKTGDIAGILGRNGAGKSSLMKIIFGSLRGENQSVRLNGTWQSTLYKLPSAINYLPQDNFLMDYLMLKELIRIYQPDIAMMEVPGLADCYTTKLGELSSGQKRLIEISLVLFSPTKFTLLDEPFSFLSPKLVETIIPFIKKQSAKKGIVLSDHQYRSVFNTCNRFYALLEERLEEFHELSDLEKFGYLPSKSEEAAGME